MVTSPYPESIRVFDRKLLQAKRGTLSKTFEKHDFLFKHCSNDISERLKDINRTFNTALQIGSRSADIQAHPKINTLVTLDLGKNPVISDNVPYIQADEEFLPIKPESLDLALSILNMHNVNDLPGSLVQIRQALKPDGLFMACLFGGESLLELRQSLMHTEIEVLGGASPRVFPFIDKMQMGDLMQRAGFALPVIDSEIIKVSYNSMFDLIKDIRGMGEHNIINKRNKTYTGKSFFMKAAQYYQDHFPAPDQKIEATFEIIYAAGWSPHDSQQKPLQPGSAEYSLEEALNNPNKR
ncbi:MAG: class I SAM-dependent methyltransferase [Alphaproteobacteria bacterium]|nr:class I SAM-dependent methyltransferase [Alphaproteobacteria bacterium]